MGLDMDLYMVKRKVSQQEIFEVKNEELIEVLYWRKYYLLQRFIMNTLWDKFSSGEYEPCVEDLVITKDMIKQILTFLEELEYETEDEEQCYEFDTYKALVGFKVLLNTFDFEKNTLIYACSY